MGNSEARTEHFPRAGQPGGVSPSACPGPTGPFPVPRALQAQRDMKICLGSESPSGLSKKLPSRVPSGFRRLKSPKVGLHQIPSVAEKMFSGESDN